MSFSLDVFKTLKLNGLKSLTTVIGIPSSGTKTVLAQRLVSTLEQQDQYEKLFNKATRIKSLDMGIRNLAICDLILPKCNLSTENKIGIENWKRIDIEQEFRPKEWNETVSSFDPDRLACIAHDMLEREIPGTDVVLVERQRFRSGSNANILEWTLRVNMLESMIHAILKQKGVTCISVNPRSVVSYWELLSPNLRPNLEREMIKRGKGTRYKETKDVKVRVAKNLRSHLDMLDEESISIWTQKGKWDDLADALVQGVTFIDWINNRKRLLKEMNSTKIETIPQVVDKMIEKIMDKYRSS